MSNKNNKEEEEKNNKASNSRMDLRDYVAFVIALLELILPPVLIFSAVLILVFILLKFA